MNALIFIESPLQLLNAVEAINFFGIQKFKMVLRLSGNLRSDSQLLTTLKLLNIDANRVSIIKIKVVERGVVDLLKILFYSKRYVLSKWDYIFIGNADSGFLKRVKRQFARSQVIYLDDGAKTITLAKERVQEEFKCFSIFDIAGKSNFLNKYDHLKLIMSKIEYSIQKDKILFLGQKIAEINVVSQAQYIDLIKEFSVSNSGESIVYISHRGEDLTKLNEINQISNIEVIELDYPIELYAFYNKIIPYRVVSFYSTALYTMKIIYGIQAESIRIDVKDPGVKDSIDAVYTFYSNTKIVENMIDCKY